MNDEELTPELAIAKALARVRDEAATRSQSLTITKLEEAGFWLKNHRQELLKKAREAGHMNGVPNGGDPR